MRVQASIAEALRGAAVARACLVDRTSLYESMKANASLWRGLAIFKVLESNHCYGVEFIEIPGDPSTNWTLIQLPSPVCYHLPISNRQQVTEMN